jgi:hypothetical protein
MHRGRDIGIGVHTAPTRSDRTNVLHLRQEPNEIHLSLLDLQTPTKSSLNPAHASRTNLNTG